MVLEVDLLKGVIAAFAVSFLASAATPVASLTSSADFQLSGSAVKTAGVSSWPILPGDRIGCGATAATLRFIDGTVVTLRSLAQAKVEQDKDGIAVRLLSGSMSFVGVPGSAVRFYSGDVAVQSQAGVSTTVASSGSGNGGSVSNRGVAPSPPPALSGR
jgi:hypothetical protein